MRRIVTTTWVTMDGFLAGPNNEMDFVTSLFDAEMGKYESDIVDTGDTIILGRVTYESFAGSWPRVPDNPNVSDDEKDYARRLNRMKKIVYSKTLASADWNNSTLYRSIDPDEIRRIKGQPGKDMLIYGSASIVSAFTRLGLIDEYQILCHPVYLGSGKPLFQGLQKPLKLKLKSVKTFGSGVVLFHYMPS